MKTSIGQDDLRVAQWQQSHSCSTGMVESGPKLGPPLLQMTMTGTAQQMLAATRWTSQNKKYSVWSCSMKSNITDIFCIQQISNMSHQQAAENLLGVTKL